MKKALALYDKISKHVSDFESDLETRIYNKISTLVSKAKSGRLDKRIEADIKICDEKLAQEDLSTEIKEKVEKYKKTLQEEGAKQDAFTKEFQEFNDEVHEKLKNCQNFYDLGELSDKYYDKQSNMLSKNADSVDTVNYQKRELDRFI